MKALFFVVIASLFASEFEDMGEDEIKLGKIVKKLIPVVVPKIPKIGPIIAPFLGEEDAEDEIKYRVKLEIHNQDMFAPEFDEIDDELKIKIGSIIKKLIPIVVPKIPHIGPIIAPFLSEEDMEPELVEYDEDELAALVLAELGEEYEMDAGFWKKIGTFIKKVAPTIIKKVVPMIPKVGPIIAPFLSEEDEESEMVGAGPIPQGRFNCRFPKAWDSRQKKCVLIFVRRPVATEGREMDMDELKLGKILKKIGGTVIKKLIPKIPKVGPIIAPFLGEEDSDEIEITPEMEELVLAAFAEELVAQGYELDEGFWKKIGSYLKPRIPQIIRTNVPMIPKVGPKIAPIIEPFLGEEDQYVRVPPKCHPGLKCSVLHRCESPLLK